MLRETWCGEVCEVKALVLSLSVTQSSEFIVPMNSFPTFEVWIRNAISFLECLYIYRN